MKWHTVSQKLLLSLLDNYVSKHNLGFVGFEKVMTKFTRNDYEPDICFFESKKSKNFARDHLHYPVPDLAIEVLSKSSQKMIDHNRKTKYNDYQQHGVAEYWIIDPEEETVEQYILQTGSYELRLKSAEGTIESSAVKGFKIPIGAIFDVGLMQGTLLDILTA